MESVGGVGAVNVVINEGDFGRILTSKIEFNAGSEIFNCRSTNIAVDATVEVLERFCFWCGQHKIELPISCSSCQAHFCAGCASGLDLHVGQECGLIVQYEKMTGCPLVRQGVLAMRLLLYPQQRTEHGVDVFDLVGQAEDCDETRRELAAAMRKACCECLSCPSSIQSVLNEQKLLHVLNIMHRNAFKSGDIITVFPMLSLMNHSCTPNSVVTIGYESGPDGAPFLAASVRALRQISINEEVTISYYPLGLHPTHIRQEIILSRHGFVCGCDACTGDESADDILLEQHETHFGDVQLTLEPLLVVFESWEEEVAATDGADAASGSSVSSAPTASTPVGISTGTVHHEVCQEGEDTTESEEEADDRFDDLNFLLERAQAGVDNLKLSKLHYLSLKYLALCAESFLLQQRRQDVVQCCEEWRRRIDGAPASIKLLCDPHLRCRMLVLQAESSAHVFLSSDEGTSVLSKTKKHKNKVIDVVTRAIAYAAIIYGEEYALCQVLVKQREIVVSSPCIDCD